MSGDIHRKHNRIEDLKPAKTYETDNRTIKSFDGDTKIETAEVDEENNAVSKKH